MTGSQDPQLGFTAIQEAAVQMHELFRTFRESGFTERQALTLVGQLMTASITAAEPAGPCPHCGRTPT